MRSSTSRRRDAAGRPRAWPARPPVESPFVGWKDAERARLPAPLATSRQGASGPTGADRGDRLTHAPILIPLYAESGSTLLRVILNSHPEIHSPHELHFRYTRVRLTKRWEQAGDARARASAPELEYLLWDRILHRIH